MKQQINLYQSELQPAQLAFPFRRVVQGTALVLVLLAALSALAAWDGDRQIQQLEVFKQQRDQKQAQLAQLEAQFPPPQEDPALKAAIARLELELAAKQDFLGGFANDALGNMDGFSPALAALARRPLDGLWLREIQLRGDGQVTLKGGALRPAAVPAFVRRLGEEPVFLGRGFKALRIERDPAGGPLAFTLGNVGEEE